MSIENLAIAVAQNLAEELVRCRHKDDAREVIQRAVASLRATGHANAIGAMAGHLPEAFRRIAAETGAAESGPPVEVENVVREFSREGWKQ